MSKTIALVSGSRIEEIFSSHSSAVVWSIRPFNETNQNPGLLVSIWIVRDIAFLLI
jgi:hypothetical protein